LDRAYRENATLRAQVPTVGVPRLLEAIRPLHAVVRVDLFVQGCPPPADAIWYVLHELIEGRVPDPTSVTRFGA
jgi:NAD-reducing hydrogenase small subunit